MSASVLIGRGGPQSPRRERVVVKGRAAAVPGEDGGPHKGHSVNHTRENPVNRSYREEFACRSRTRRSRSHAAEVESATRQRSRPLPIRYHCPKVPDGRRGTRKTRSARSSGFTPVGGGSQPQTAEPAFTGPLARPTILAAERRRIDPVVGEKFVANPVTDCRRSRYRSRRALDRRRARCTSAPAARSSLT